MCGQQGRGQPRWRRNNGFTLSPSISEEDNSGTLSESCQPPSLHTHLVMLLKVTCNQI